MTLKCTHFDTYRDGKLPVRHTSVAINNGKLMGVVKTTEETTIYLHQNIRYLRKQLKLSQEELGTRIGLNRGNIASYENGSAEPKICNLLKLSNFFSVSILDLTKKDLSNEANLRQASKHYHEIPSNEAELMEQFMRRAQELQSVIQSIQTCYDFKTKSLDEATKSSKAFQMANMKFEELFDASAELLNNHHALVDYVRCHLHK